MCMYVCVCVSVCVCVFVCQRERERERERAYTHIYRARITGIATWILKVRRHVISQKSYIVNLYIKYTRALTFENLLFFFW